MNKIDFTISDEIAAKYGFSLSTDDYNEIEDCVLFSNLKIEAATHLVCRKKYIK